MKPGGCGCGLERRHSLREQRGNDASQNVPAPAGRELSGGVRIDDRATVWGGDHGIGALEQDDRVALPRSVPGALQLVALEMEQARELACVRGQHTRANNGSKQVLWRVGERSQRVGVEHGRSLGRERGKDEPPCR